MLNIQGIHHISVACLDIERSKNFYGDILGLKEITRPAFDFAGAWYELGMGQQLHLIVVGQSDYIRANKDIPTRDNHIALSTIGKYDEIIAYLKENSVPFYENTKTKSGFVQVFCLDPDQHIIELNIRETII